MSRVARRTRGRAPVQGELRFRSWGGRRSGAGRPREPSAGVSHVTRPRVTRHTPVHVTLKLRREVASLRTKAKAGAVRRALVGAVAAGFAVVDWSIQRPRAPRGGGTELRGFVASRPGALRPHGSGDQRHPPATRESLRRPLSCSCAHNSARGSSCARLRAAQRPTSRRATR
jgi:hypothetical protein